MRAQLVVSITMVAALTGCGHGDPPTSPPAVGPVQVDSVAVQISETRPAQVFSRITGVVGDGCSTLLPIEQRRTDSLIEIAITRQRPRDAICTQIARLFDETVRLMGDFPPGPYRLRVNDSERSFVVD